jgi:hypothetical protein
MSRTRCIRSRSRQQALICPGCYGFVAAYRRGTNCNHQRGLHATREMPDSSTHQERAARSLWWYPPSCARMTSTEAHFVSYNETRRAYKDGKEIPTIFPTSTLQRVAGFVCKSLKIMEHRMGFEPMNTGFADQRVSHFATGALVAATSIMQRATQQEV